MYDLVELRRRADILFFYSINRKAYTLHTTERFRLNGFSTRVLPQRLGQKHEEFRVYTHTSRFVTLIFERKKGPLSTTTPLHYALIRRRIIKTDN